MLQTQDWDPDGSGSQLEGLWQIATMRRSLPSVEWGRGPD